MFWMFMKSYPKIFVCVHEMIPTIMNVIYPEQLKKYIFII